MFNPEYLMKLEVFMIFNNVLYNVKEYDAILERAFEAEMRGDLYTYKMQKSLESDVAKFGTLIVNQLGIKKEFIIKGRKGRK